VTRYETGEEELEVSASCDPVEEACSTDTEPVLLKKKTRKKKSKSGKHRAKKRKKKKKKHVEEECPAIKLEPGSLDDLVQRDYSTLTPAQQVDVDNAPPEISSLEMELMRYPDYKRPLYALVNGDLTEFVTERPTDLRLVRECFPDVKVGSSSLN
jgi:hypothetical protein